MFSSIYCILPVYTVYYIFLSARMFCTPWFYTVSAKVHVKCIFSRFQDPFYIIMIRESSNIKNFIFLGKCLCMPMYHGCNCGCTIKSLNKFELLLFRYSCSIHVVFLPWTILFFVGGFVAGNVAISWF